MKVDYTYAEEELQKQGFCILKGHLAVSLIDNCRVAFLPVLQNFLENNGHLPNRGTNRYFLPMPFEPPCFVPEFFFDETILNLVKSILGDKIMADH